MNLPLWGRCVDHYDSEVDEFFRLLFSEGRRNCLFIAGAGFDPRATLLAGRLNEVAGDRLSCLFIREERPNPDAGLFARAEANLNILQGMCKTNRVLTINVFSDDNAVVGGINAVSVIANAGLNGYTDIVIDLSALSIGISFPIVKFAYDEIRNSRMKTNIHLVVVSNPELDSLISSAPNDRITEVRGFSRSDRLYGEDEKARLWMPQLSGGRKETLRLLFNDVRPHDTCPILPFPSDDPKKGDELAVDFIAEIENEWMVDTRNFVYADERNSLDIYRTILRIDDERKPVFESFGGSVVILSPLGSKMLAIGALLAALERNFPVVYVESLEYNVEWSRFDEVAMDNSRVAHIWLYGEAYLRDILGQC
jgi:hypothetical protein